MKRDRLFPTKSRLQLAISLQLLTMAQDFAFQAVLRHAIGDSDDLIIPAYSVAWLCQSRLIFLLKPALYERAAAFYDYRERLKQHSTRDALTIVRGWRKRWPQLLNPRGEN